MIEKSPIVSDSQYTNLRLSAGNESHYYKSVRNSTATVPDYIEFELATKARKKSTGHLKSNLTQSRDYEINHSYTNLTLEAVEPGDGKLDRPEEAGLDDESDTHAYFTLERHEIEDLNNDRDGLSEFVERETEGKINESPYENFDIEQ